MVTNMAQQLVKITKKSRQKQRFEEQLSTVTRASENIYENMKIFENIWNSSKNVNMCESVRTFVKMYDFNAIVQICEIALMIFKDDFRSRSILNDVRSSPNFACT